MRFEDRVALIVGADCPISSAVAHALAQQEVKIVIADENEEAAKQLASEIGGAIGFGCDVTQTKQVNDVIANVIEQHGKIDILFYNVWKNERKPAEEVSDELLDQILDKNAKGAFRFVRTAIKKTMKKNRYGRIIITVAMAGLMGIPQEVPFSMAHATIMGFIRCIAKESGGRKITINGIGIGTTPEELETYTDEIKGDLERARAISRMLKPSDVVDAVLMFASDDSAYTTGETLLIGGGAYPR